MDMEELRAAATAAQLRDYPQRPTTAVVPPTAGRPDISALYDRLGTLSGAPLDYSGVEDVSRKRTAQGNRGVDAGLVMSLMGGESMKGAAGHILTQALAESRPIRPNAADLGYIDPEGKFVENPQLARTRDEKVVTGRIDALVKEQEAKARIAIAQGDKGAADIARQNHDTLKSMLVMVAAQNANSNAVRADSAATRAAGGGTSNPTSSPKPISSPILARLEDNVGNIAQLRDLTTLWKDTHAPGWGPLGRARVRGEQFIGGAADEGGQERANWWSQFQMFQELPMRHKLFGAALTPTESASWRAAQALNPGSDPKTVVQVLGKLLQLAEEKHNRLVAQQRTEGKDPSAFDTSDRTPKKAMTEQELLDQYDPVKK